MLVGLITLVLLWLVAVRINRPQRCTEATVWWMAAAWGTPFVLGPPLLSNDVYSYAAQGLMARRGSTRTPTARRSWATSRPWPPWTRVGAA